ncbi:MAG: MarR family transcriptional regulator [Rhizobiaceae bacterium]
MTRRPASPEDVFGFFNEIGIVAQLSGNAFERAMPEGMTLPQFALLNHMARLGDGWSPLRLARAMQVTKGAMTNTLRHLERKAMIETRPDERDGRAKKVFMTAAGHVARDECIAALTPYLQRLAADIPPAEFAAALPFLEKVRRWLDEERD